MGRSLDVDGLSGYGSQYRTGRLKPDIRRSGLRPRCRLWLHRSHGSGCWAFGLSSTRRARQKRRLRPIAGQGGALQCCSIRQRGRTSPPNPASKPDCGCRRRRRRDCACRGRLYQRRRGWFARCSEPRFLKHLRAFRRLSDDLEASLRRKAPCPYFWDGVV